MDTVKPKEETKSKQFYILKDSIETKTLNPDILLAYKKASESCKNIPIEFICWECDSKHAHFFYNDYNDWNLICQRCGKKFYDMVDVTSYKEIK